MRKREELLDILRQYYFRTNNERCKKFLDEMCGYYKQIDFETGRRHGEIFQSLYMRENPLPYDELSAKFYIDTYTLDRYRQRYNRLAEHIIEPELLEQVYTAKTVR